MYTIAHYNGSNDGWVESGPYLHGWYNTRQDAERALPAVKAEHPEWNGWNTRWAILSEEEYHKA